MREGLYGITTKTVGGTCNEGIAQGVGVGVLRLWEEEEVDGIRLHQADGPPPPPYRILLAVILLSTAARCGQFGSEVQDVSHRKDESRYVGVYDEGCGVKIVCAWCKSVMQEGPAFPVSHGICPECKEKALREVASRVSVNASGGSGATISLSIESGPAPISPLLSKTHSLPRGERHRRSFQSEATIVAFSGSGHLQKSSHPLSLIAGGVRGLFTDRLCAAINPKRKAEVMTPGRGGTWAAGLLACVMSML